MTGTPQHVRMRPGSGGIVIGDDDETSFHSLIMTELDEELEEELSLMKVGQRPKYRETKKKTLTQLYSPSKSPTKATFGSPATQLSTVEFGGGAKKLIYEEAAPTKPPKAAVKSTPGPAISKPMPVGAPSSTLAPQAKAMQDYEGKTLHWLLQCSKATAAGTMAGLELLSVLCDDTPSAGTGSGGLSRKRLDALSLLVDSTSHNLKTLNLLTRNNYCHLEVLLQSGETAGFNGAKLQQLIDAAGGGKENIRSMQMLKIAAVPAGFDGLRKVLFASRAS
jgi:hypothetical protein|eukprot:CAMPEP_0174303476 /NCGR_PEP_ID=MMETSP0809-20121228/60206_1 /TAXON_ID=73025 ORGANISM="Eutreptiella gymnastica-like, Strain CCMP1594" /NCGR_SAMPLE_ID=MMETSP0809 /ASSEMBLY_ACC=CAM_ASM_000658 /LENGTH=277 /DNA_ID=CAMNT_0015409505 /DNA_START=24 /DNA_END=857 /DNA_ORIENTATION=-